MKTRIEKAVWITAAIAVVSLGIAAALFFTTGLSATWERGNGIRIDEARSIAAEEISEIALRSGSTDVIIAAGEGETVEIRLRGVVYAADDRSAAGLHVDRQDDFLQIGTEPRDGRVWNPGFFSSDLVLEVRIPGTYRGGLAVRSSSGDLQISDQTLSRLSAVSSSGEILLKRIEAEQLYLESSSGDQEADTLRGGVRAESSSGSITLRFNEFESDLEIRSSSGDVELYLTETAEFRVQARASSGDVECAFPVSVVVADGEIQRNRLSGVVGAGTHQVTVRTSSGDITIRR